MTKQRARWQVKAVLLALMAPLVALTGPGATPANAAKAPTYTHAGEWIYATHASEAVSAVAVDQRGRVYAAGNRIGQPAKVRVYNASGKLLNTWNPLDFKIVGDMEIAPNGQVHITDYAGNVAEGIPSSVKVYQPNGTFVRSYGLPGTSWSAAGLALASDGTAYVADSTSDAIHRFKPNGTYDTSFGSPAGAGTAPGVYDSPSDVDIAPGGTLVVADAGNHRVQVVSASTGAPIRHWGSDGISDGQFVGSVVAIEVHQERVYALDWTSRIQVFNLRGTHLTTLKPTTRRAGHLADELTNLAFGPTHDMYVGARLYPFENGIARYTAGKSSRVKITGKLDATKNRKKAKLPVKCVKGTTTCVGKVVAKAGKKTFAKGKVKLGRNTSAKVTLKLTKPGRKALKKKAKIKVKVTIRLATGNVTKKVRLTR